MKNFAHFARVSGCVFYGFLALVCLLALLNETPGTRFFYLVLAVFCYSSTQFTNSLTLRLVLIEDTIVYKTWFRKKTIEINKVSSLIDERWDGGGMMIPPGPKKLRVLSVRMKNQYFELDFAFMPRKQLDQLVTEIRLRAPQKIKGYKPSSTSPETTNTQ